MEQITSFLFSNGGYPALGSGIALDPFVQYTHVVADLLIALSYFAISALILMFVRRHADPALRAPAILFVCFITACGISNLMSFATMYLPLQGVHATVKLVTGVISFVTALALWRIMPTALKIPSPTDLMRVIETRDSEISERVAAEVELMNQNRLLDQKVLEAEAANRELREFSYAASHDLKAPANTLSLWLQYFEDENADKLDDEGRASIEEAARIVGRMRALVDDVLKYARVVNGEPDERYDIDPNAVFADVIEDLRPQIERARVEIDILPMPKFEGYAPLVSILAHNLLSNAIKFRSPDRSPQIRVSGRMTGGDAPSFELRVKDNGIGIDTAYSDRIFRLFQRLHRPEDYEGTGLGLALCRRIAVTHGGTIEVVSQEEEGAEFIVTFPQEITHVAEAA